MIHFNIPSIYYGLHTVDSVLDTAKKYYPETRRWSAKGSTLVDKQAGETLEVPRFSFVLFLGGNPTVVPFDLISVLAMPWPSLTVPDLADISAPDQFLLDFKKLTSQRPSSRLVMEGINKDEAFLEYSSVYDPTTRMGKAGESETEIDGKIKLNAGDTLFTYSYPRELSSSSATREGDIDYMPTSRTIELTQVPASDSLDLSTPVHKRNWSTIWPRR